MDFLELWRGKHVCFLGDSITDGVAIAPGCKYFEVLEKKLGFIAHGYGVNGHRFRELLGQIDRMEAECGENVDAVFIFCGTNDFFGNTIIGDWYTEVREEVEVWRDENHKTLFRVPRAHHVFNTDIETFTGAVNTVLMRLKHDYPKATIVLMTPIHRAFAYFGNMNIQHDETYPNIYGNTFEEYVEKVREASRIFATELIDLNVCSQLYPLDDACAEVYFNNTARNGNDRLHPSEYGHKRMAQAILHKLPGIIIGEPDDALNI